MSRFARAASDARKVWLTLRARPIIARIEAARRRNADDPPDRPAIGDRMPTGASLPSGAGDAKEPDDGESDDDGPTDPPPQAPPGANDGVPNGLKIAGGWSWRALVIAAVVYGVLYLSTMLAIIVIPLLISLLLAAMLQPIAAFLINKLRVPRSLAAAVVLIGGLGAVAAVLTWVVGQIVSEADKLWTNVQKGITELQEWAKDGPLGLDQPQIDGYIDSAQRQITEWINDNQGELAGTGLDALVVLFNAFAGFFLVLFITYFFLRDGRRIFEVLTRMLPARAQEPVTKAGNASWRGLVGFIQGTILVAIVDAVGIGIGLVILDVPLAIPLAALVFLGAFVPIVGATVTGALAVLVALVGTDDPATGWITALIVLAVVLGVQQVESNLLQPLIMGRAVSIHPLPIVLAVGAGVVTYGIIGALLAVPLLAILTSGAKAIRAHYNDLEGAISSAPPDSSAASDNVAR